MKTKMSVLLRTWITKALPLMRMVRYSLLIIFLMEWVADIEMNPAFPFRGMEIIMAALAIGIIELFIRYTWPSE